MDKDSLLELLETSPIVAAVKDEEGLLKCLHSDCKVVFILYGSILNIDTIVEKVKAQNRIAFVHVDLIEGLSLKETSVDFIKQKTNADGIISTKMPLIKYAKQKGFLTVQRFFLLDSIALTNLSKQIKQSDPDLVEVLPGCLPKIIKIISSMTDTRVIAGGLIQDKEDILSALNAGALGISATRSEIWAM